MSSCTWRPSTPPFLLTVSAHSFYPCSKALPSAEKSPERDKEIPILMGVLGWLLPLVAVVLLLLLPPHALSTRSAAINKPTIFSIGCCHKAVRLCTVVLLFLRGNHNVYPWFLNATYVVFELISCVAPGDCRKQFQIFAHSLSIFVSSFDMLTKLLRLTPKVPGAPLSALLPYPGIA